MDWVVVAPWLAIVGLAGLTLAVVTERIKIARYLGAALGVSLSLVILIEPFRIALKWEDVSAEVDRNVRAAREARDEAIATKADVQRVARTAMEAAILAAETSRQYGGATKEDMEKLNQYAKELSDLTGGGLEEEVKGDLEETVRKQRERLERGNPQAPRSAPSGP